MVERIEKMLRCLEQQLEGQVSRLGTKRYRAATDIFARQTDRLPRAIVHCLKAEDVQAAVRIAREAQVPISVRGGGHDWEGRALCEGVVLDLRGMNGVVIASDKGSANVSGGALARDVLKVTDPLGLGAVTGSCSTVGMAGLALGGGYGPLSSRFGLALDNMLAAQVVLADGSIVLAGAHREEELFWALRGGGGNFGVVTSMQYRLHDVPSVLSGTITFPFAEARTVLSDCSEILANSPQELDVQLACVAGADGVPLITIVPTWSGDPAHGEGRLAPLLKLGTLIANSVGPMTCGGRVAISDGDFAKGQSVFLETCWLAALDSFSIDALIQAMETAVSPGCAILTHDFRGAATRVSQQATAFGVRRDHVLIEILALTGHRGVGEQQRHREWAQEALRSFSETALPGGYPNLLPRGAMARAAQSYGDNAERLIRAKRRYDSDNVFRSAIPLPG